LSTTAPSRHRPRLWRSGFVRDQTCAGRWWPATGVLPRGPHWHRRGRAVAHPGLLADFRHRPYTAQCL